MASELLDVSRSFPSSAQDQAQSLPSGAVCRRSSASQKRDCPEQPLSPQALLPEHLHRRARGRRGGGAGRVSGKRRPQASGLLAASGDVGAAGRKQLFGQSTRGRHALGSAAANIVVDFRTRRWSADAGYRWRFVGFRRRAARTVGPATSGLAGGRCGRCCRVGRAGASAAAARRSVAAIRRAGLGKPHVCSDARGDGSGGWRGGVAAAATRARQRIQLEALRLHPALASARGCVGLGRSLQEVAGMVLVPSALACEGRPRRLFARRRSRYRGRRRRGARGGSGGASHARGGAVGGEGHDRDKREEAIPLQAQACVLAQKCQPLSSGLIRCAGSQRIVVRSGAFVSLKHAST
mmetsp:Transcript_75199/g.243418  ORF Transcript_75199/g.243418 Transcript_75199/m.243418 type:complete len:352 (+) Transcript_75199:678-1733(+)